MVSQIKKDVATGIVDFLRKSIKDGTVTGDDKESLEVAIDCISEVFSVDETKTSEIYGSEGLESLVQSLKSGNTTTNTEAGSKDNAKEDSTSKPVEVSPEAVQAAEEFKIEGNRAMAQKKFQDAIDSYTKAIESNPNNAIYYSNRSAAYSSIRESTKAADDARKAIELDPTYSKAYSRLGLALYSMGDAEAAMKAYEDGLKAEGDSPSDGMKKGYETAKKRVQEDLDAATGSVTGQSSESSNQQDTNRSGSGTGPADMLGNLSNLMGALGGGGGGGSGGNSFMDMFSNPQFQNMAQQFMAQNPGYMSEIMADPQAAMRRHLGSDNLDSLMNSDMMRNFSSALGGAGQGGNNNQGNNQGGNSS